MVDIYYHQGGSTCFLSILANSKKEAETKAREKVSISDGIRGHDISKVEVS